jgi:hypothetical protein
MPPLYLSAYYTQFMLCGLSLIKGRKSEHFTYGEISVAVSVSTKMVKS